MNDLIYNLLNHMGSNSAFACMFAVLAGIATSLGPCAISNVALLAGVFNAGEEITAKSSIKLSLVFTAGTTAVFVALGAFVSVIGHSISSSAEMYIILGIFMLLAALYTWDFWQLPHRMLSKYKFGPAAFLAGCTGGVLSSPCCTPVIFALLSISFKEGSILYGIFLMVIYSIFHNLPVIFAGMATGLVNGIINNERYGIIHKSIKKILGFAILMLGFYYFYLGF